MTLARKAVFRMLSRLRHGVLKLVCPERTYTFGDGTGSAGNIRACVAVHNERFFSRLLHGGDDAAGDSFVDGDWSSPDLVAVVRLAARNQGQLEGGNIVLSTAYKALNRLRHRMRRNTEAGSRRNIHEHYDLSNDFFRLFLDRSMVYSSAVYRNADDSLEEAQTEKLDRICRKLMLKPGDRVLEIGTGWGAFALHAARRYGCTVTTTTISRQQHDHARNAFESAGEAGSRITLLLEDYRRLQGTYDKLVSIEMFEAVGLEFYDAFFSTCDRLLTPEGSLVMQTITMNEHRFAGYSKQSDWIQRRIFPGGQLASVREILNSLLRSTKLSLYHVEEIGMHYAETLAEWRRRFHDAIDEVRVLGFDEPFCRTWDYYLAFSEGAFRERHIGDVQIMLTKNFNPSPLIGEPASAHRPVAISAKNYLTHP